MSNVNHDGGEPLPWDAACRWQQFEAELRANVVRLVAVAVFYAVHLGHYWAARGSTLFSVFGLDAGSAVSPEAHTALTCIAIAWAMMGLWIHFLLTGRRFPDWLMYVSTGCDVVMLTAVLAISSGPASPLITAYFLIVMMSGMRFNLLLVYFATTMVIGSYVFVLGCAKWPVGLIKLSALPSTPRYQQLMVIAALLLAGVLAGQWVRQTRRLGQRLTSTQSEAAS